MVGIAIRLTGKGSVEVETYRFFNRLQTYDALVCHFDLGVP